MTDAEQAALDSLKQVLGDAAKGADSGNVVADAEKKLEGDVAKAVEPVVEEVAEDEAKKLLTQAQEILAAHDNKESDIPHAHAYWGIMNKFRALLRK